MNNFAQLGQGLKFTNNYSEIPIKNKNPETLSDGVESVSLQNSRSSMSQKSKIPEKLKVSLVKRQSLGVRSSFPIISPLQLLNIKVNMCPICETQQQPNTMTSMSGCPHKFCGSCLNAYVIYKLQANEDLHCPQQGCGCPISLQSQAFLSLPENYRHKCRRYLLWKQTINNPNLSLCPNETCIDGTLDLTQPNLKCNSCSMEYCKTCMMPAHKSNESCDDNFIRSFKEWKRCSQCRQFIERTEGCNHMTCICGNEFCYLCGSRWNNSHYSCGQNFEDQFIRQNVAQRGWCERGLLVLLLILLFPIVCVLMLVGMLIVLALAYAVSVVMLPCLLANLDCCKAFLFVVFLPIIIVFGVIAIFFKVVGQGIPYSFLIIVRYCECIGRIYQGQ